MTKVCAFCLNTKPVEEFKYNIHYTTRDKYDCYCMECLPIKRHADYIKRKTEIKDELVAKQCNKCSLLKRATDFHKSPGNVDGRAGTCKSCLPSQRAKHLKSNYKITIAQYDELKNKQSGKCALCGASNRRLVVDHDHTTKKVRGLLCDKCNSGLGKLGDNVEGLLRAITYIKEAVSV